MVLSLWCVACYYVVVVLLLSGANVLMWILWTVDIDTTAPAVTLSLSVIHTLQIIFGSP